MSHFDVFNGDADGMCALHMLRLAQPRDAQLVTGTKRDHALLSRVAAVRGDSVTVVDIALSHNLAALQALLARGVAVEYFDHHCTPSVPEHPLLDAHIDVAAEVCTGVLVDRHLGGKHRPWAVVAAFGDNMAGVARRLGAALGLPNADLAALCELGECLNYNAYGIAEDDLMYAPGALYRRLHGYADPLRFIAEEDVLARLKVARDADLQAAEAVAARVETARSAVYLLPDAPWSRRVLGSLANRLADRMPARAFAVLAPYPGGGWSMVTVRAPCPAGPSADEFARRFGGGGRTAAAGIDRLAEAQLERFFVEFGRTFLDPG